VTDAYRAVVLLLIVASITFGVVLGAWVHTTLST
jgi:uncharacterized protein YneF (UPF0154 family)